MELPASIRILGSPWLVKKETELLEAGEMWGCCLPASRTIYLRPDADQPTVLIHELLHAIEHAQGIDVPDSAIQLLARGLVATLADNPGLRDWLIEHL